MHAVISEAEYNTKQIENINLESFIVELYTDKHTFNMNMGLLKACFVEWQNTKQILEQHDKVTHIDYSLCLL